MYFNYIILSFGRNDSGLNDIFILCFIIMCKILSNIDTPSDSKKSPMTVSGDNLVCILLEKN